jgi:thymidylate synthase ThyX
MSTEPTTEIIRDPKVYLVGRQTVDDAALAAFLDDHGVSTWTTDTDVAGEKLIEIAGRACYLSFSKPRPGGNKAYVGHILDVGHGSVLEHSVYNLIITGVSRAFSHELVRHRAGFGYCLTGGTLIYSDHRCRGKRGGTKKRSIEAIFKMKETPHGRSRLKLLAPRCLDESNGTFTNGRVRSVVCSGMREVFHVVLEDGKSITCSKDHRFLTQAGWRSLDEIVGGLRVMSTLAVAHGTLDVPIAVNGEPAYKNKDWLKRQYHDLNRPLADIASDCGLTVSGLRNWIRIHGLYKPRGSWTKGVSPWNKGKKYKAGWTHSEETKKHFSAQKLGEKNPAWRGGITRVAVVLRRESVELRPRVFERDGYRCRLCGRGSKSLEVHHILPIWARPDLADDFDNLAAVCVPCHDAMAGRELEFVTRFDVAPPDPETLRERRKGGGNILVPRWRKIARIEYAGVQTTYDIEMEEPYHNFVANGIVTHNSQLSQRFVDESSCAFVEPDVIAADPELHRVWLEAVQASQRAYRALADGLAAKFTGVEDRTLRRKMAREAARSVLPNATETKIFVTANGRALRHFIEMRADPAADAEIRKVAVAVLRLLQAESPNLFGDYTLTDLPGGGQAASTPHRKV